VTGVLNKPFAIIFLLDFEMYLVLNYNHSFLQN